MPQSCLLEPLPLGPGRPLRGDESESPLGPPGTRWEKIGKGGAQRGTKPNTALQKARYRFWLVATRQALPFSLTSVLPRPGCPSLTPVRKRFLQLKVQILPW